MKLVTFDLVESPSSPSRIGVVVESTGCDVEAAPILDLHVALRWAEAQAGRASDHGSIADRFGRDMLGLIERQDQALPRIRELLALQAQGAVPDSFEGRSVLLARPLVRLLAPIPRPLSMRDGYAFRQHVEAARRNRGLPMIPEFDEIPIFYYTNHLSVVGPGPVRVRPLHTQQLDFELEAAVVIGRTVRDADLSTANAAIFGLMVMNDLSARALQMHEMKLNLGPAKGKDFATSIGPYLVPIDDLGSTRQPGPRGDQFELRMVARHNGEQVAAGRLSDMSWTFAEIIARACYGVTLHPGEVIGSGTVGTGCFLETNGSKIYDNRWLAPGDTIECEIEGLGCLRNTIELVP